MKEETTEYSLERLSELTEVQERTIRAYIAQGLLPSPVGKGRGAYYTEVHRKRLKIIKQLRDRYGLPLDQIRQLLMTAGDNEDVQIVPVTLASPRVIPRVSRAFPEQESDQPEYGKADMPSGSVRASTLSPLYASVRECGAERDSYGDSRLEQLVLAIQKLVRHQPRGRFLRSEACSLVQVTPDISLLIKGNYAPHELALFEQLAESLREALTRGLILEQQTDDE